MTSFQVMVPVSSSLFGVTPSGTVTFGSIVASVVSPGVTSTVTPLSDKDGVSVSCVDSPVVVDSSLFLLSSAGVFLYSVSESLLAGAVLLMGLSPVVPPVLSPLPELAGLVVVVEPVLLLLPAGAPLSLPPEDPPLALLLEVSLLLELLLGVPLLEDSLPVLPEDASSAANAGICITLIHMTRAKSRDKLRLQRFCKFFIITSLSIQNLQKSIRFYYPPSSLFPLHRNNKGTKATGSFFGRNRQVAHRSNPLL
ncbi:MAG: hypothetical protein MR419_10610 [Clostridiales bacterium]|nr:hypothetical protein [Clostridiales bacterium]MDY4172519.1 hypothetical protein [Evtepia sp.]